MLEDTTRNSAHTTHTPVLGGMSAQRSHAKRHEKKLGSDPESEAIKREINMLGTVKGKMLEWFEFLDNKINRRSSLQPTDFKNLRGVYSKERRALLTLIYKIPYKLDLVDVETISLMTNAMNDELKDILEI
jgi:hypothetical protein